MPDLSSEKSDHESNHAPRGLGGGGAAADPSSGLEDWWNTPASLVGPPAVDPAIYGIEPDDVGVASSVGSSAIAAMVATPKTAFPQLGERPHTIVDDVVADIEATHVPGDSLDAHLGMFGAASAQAAPARTRADHVSASEGNRAATMSAQMMLAARKIEASIAEIESVLATPLGARSADGVYEHLESLVAQAVAEHGRIHGVFREQTLAALRVPIASVNDALKHLGRAAQDLQFAQMKVKNFASQHQVKVNKLDAKRIRDDFDGIEDALHTEVDIVGVGKVKATEQELQNESLEQSLQGLDESTQGLVLALRGPDPEVAMKDVLPGLLSNHRMLRASLVAGIKPTKKMVDRGKRIAAAMKDAWREAGPPKLQANGDLKFANDNVSATISELEALAKGKKK